MELYFIDLKKLIIRKGKNHLTTPKERVVKRGKLKCSPPSHV
jgi:hypothetical protein